MCNTLPKSVQLAAAACCCLLLIAPPCCAPHAGCFCAACCTLCDCCRAAWSHLPGLAQQLVCSAAARRRSSPHPTHMCAEPRPLPAAASSAAMPCQPCIHPRAAAHPHEPVLGLELLGHLNVVCEQGSRGGQAVRGTSACVAWSQWATACKHTSGSAAASSFQHCCNWRAAGHGCAAQLAAARCGWLAPLASAP